MKRLFLFLLLHAATVACLQAQEGFWCGTSTEPSKWTETYLSNRYIYQKSNEVLYVPLTIQLVGTDDGQNYAPIKSVLTALCKLNQEYLPHQIQFFISGNFRFINNSNYYQHTSTNTGRQMHLQYRVANTINMYVVGDLGDLLGYATSTVGSGIGGDGLVMVKKDLTSASTTLSHEMGHVLGLYHTFYGWEGYEHNYTENAPTIVNSNRAVERVDATNCETAGDGLCDTSPDYLKDRWGCNENGLSTIVQKDPIGTTFRSDATNIMSYADDNCVTRFTEAQVQVMRTNLTTSKRNFIAPQLSIPNIDSLVVNLESPQKADTVAFNDVILKWTAVPGATNYLVEVSRISNFAGTLTETYTATTNTLFLSDLGNNRTYYWRVRAYNGASFCSNTSNSSSFRTATTAATPTTGVKDLSTRATFRVFPNPISDQQTLQIESNIQENTQLNIRLFDLSGKLLKTATYDVLAGVHTLPFTPGNLSKGIYILNIVSDHINITKRVIIQ